MEDIETFTINNKLLEFITDIRKNQDKMCKCNKKEASNTSTPMEIDQQNH